MNYFSKYIVCIFFVFAINAPLFCRSNAYIWLEQYDSAQTIVNRIPLPDRYKRLKVDTGSFEDWLRNLPLKEHNSPVFLYNDEKKSNQSAHFRVVDIDIGENDLQQCADAIIRLRAEYFWSNGEYDDIHFNFTNGDNAEYRKWIDGNRPIVDGDKVKWKKTAAVDSSYYGFKDYLTKVFMFAGSYSLSRELEPVPNIDEIRIGDIFIEGGFPGHAVIVVDMAIDTVLGDKVFLLAQSFMPAQDVHILKNPMDSELSPWYDIEFGDTLYTPEWIFNKRDLKRF